MQLHVKITMGLLSFTVTSAALVVCFLLGELYPLIGAVVLFSLNFFLVYSMIYTEVRRAFDLGRYMTSKEFNNMLKELNTPPAPAQERIAGDWLGTDKLDS